MPVRLPARSRRGSWRLCQDPRRTRQWSRRLTASAALPLSGAAHRGRSVPQAQSRALESLANVWLDTQVWRSACRL
jgi:hypothetical protein